MSNIKQGYPFSLFNLFIKIDLLYMFYSKSVFYFVGTYDIVSNVR